MDATVHSSPPDVAVNIFWKDPVIPRHKFRKNAEVLFSLFPLSQPNDISYLSKMVYVLACACMVTFGWLLLVL